MEPTSEWPLPSGLPVKGTGSLLKALRLLSSMANADRAGLRLNEVVSRTNLDPATAHRMLACLVAEGFLDKLPDKRYRLGPRVFELGLAAAPFHAPITRAHPHLRELAQALRVTVVLSRRSGTETVYVDRVEGGEMPPGLPSALGTRLPLGIGAAGVALLAAMPASRAEALIHTNAATYRRFGRAAPRLLHQRVVAAKSAGFAVADSFQCPGVRSVGIVVPVEHRPPDFAATHPGIPDFAISVVLGERRPFMPEMLPALRQAADNVSRAIGPAA